MTKLPLRTPLGQVRGHGAAKSGTGDFIAQRASAVLLALTAPYLLISAALNMAPGGYGAARAWVADPFVAPVLAVFILTALYHMRIGMQVVIEDYIGKHTSRAALSLLNLAVVVTIAAASVFAILKIYLGA